MAVYINGVRVDDPVLTGGVGIGGGGGGWGGGGPLYSTRSISLASAAITITSPRLGANVGPNSRIEGTASIRMVESEFIKGSGGGREFDRDWYVTNGFTVTVRVDGEEHEAQVVPQRDTLYWSYEIPEADAGEVAITALLDGTVTEQSWKNGVASPLRYRTVQRTDSVDISVVSEAPEVTASIREVNIGDPYMATINGEVESTSDIVSVEWTCDSCVNTAGSAENVSGDWSEWEADVELPNRNDEHSITITATDEFGREGMGNVQIPKGEPLVDITDPKLGSITRGWEDGGITIGIEGVIDSAYINPEYSTIETVEWHLMDSSSGNTIDTGDAEETEQSDNWSDWRFDLDINDPRAYILEVQAVDTAGTRSAVTESSTLEVKIVVPGVYGEPFPETYGKPLPGVYDGPIPGQPSPSWPFPGRPSVPGRPFHWFR